MLHNNSCIKQGGTAMKMLVINGSPKKEKGGTMHITRTFLDGMNEASNNEVSTVNAVEKHIEYCRA